MMPTECRHGFVVDWGDFGECQNCDEHGDGDCPNLAECPECWAEETPPPGVKRYVVTFDVNEDERAAFLDWLLDPTANVSQSVTSIQPEEQA
jgi:hypothetical protein